jgi:1,4-dihydroxy-2-naphthoyl-CoA hydrolase
VSFRIPIQVRFQDVDAAGVLFFGRIFDYLHMAYEELVVSSGVDRARYFGGGDYIVPIAHAEADYRSPIRYGERIEVAIEVTRVGRASFQLRYRVVGPGASLRVEAATVHAFVDKETMKPISIPDPLRAFFLGHLDPEPVADHPPK